MSEIDELTTSTLEAFRCRLGRADEQQIQLMLQVSPAQRLQTMLALQTTILSSWRNRLRRAHPQLSDLELCRLLFKRLKQNG